MPKSDAALPALDRFFTYRLHRINKISDKTSALAYPAALGITLGEGRCLAAIGQFEPMSVQDLATLANLDKANASRAADALARQGLVEKGPNAQDGRSLVLRLTPSGRRTWRKTIAFIEQRNQDIFGALSASERKAFDKALDKVLAHLTEPRE